MPHPSVPADQTGWIKLGIVSTDTAMLAIVAPEVAGCLGDDWTARYLGEDGEPLERPPGAPPPEHEMVEFEELGVGDQDTAVLFATRCDGGYLVEGRFGNADGGGQMSLMEVRIRIWYCLCDCHDDDPPEENRCDGSCHETGPDSGPSA
ncbi:MAG TPA: hypothetical protein VGF32_31015 [Streptosporangiaceae bacterium]|jgi:hypothetical protein